MNSVIFLGPSLSIQAARQILPAATYLPPAAQGDVYQVCRLKPEAIGIIDGYFEHLPSVWHKEILWAMKEGIHLFGSASLGALRAAELAPFGMVGVGTIFQWYQQGVLEDDDEVAVAHGSATEGYPLFSTAMVDIRQTLAKAQAQQLITPDYHPALLAYAKSLYYPHRTYANLATFAAQQGFIEAKTFLAWIHQDKVEQKREDAQLMLRAMADFLATSPSPKKVTYHFQHTRLWEAAIRQESELQPDPTLLTHSDLLDELLL